MRISTQRKLSTVLFGLLGCAVVGHAQGTVTFDQWPPYSFAQYYTETGVQLQVLSTNGTPPQSVMGRYPGGPVYPTPFMNFVDADNGAAYLSISLLSGQQFGLESAQIGQISSVRTLEFVGHLAAGGTVSTTYYFPPYGMETFSLGPEFSRGLTRVDLFALSYSIDNIVVTVPEPAAGSLLLTFGLAAFAIRRKRSLAAANEITGVDAGGPARLAIRASWAARAAQFCR